MTTKLRNCTNFVMLTGKAGLLHLHMGDGKRGFQLIDRALDETELPARTFHPTHVNRQRWLWEDAKRLALRGCTVQPLGAMRYVAVASAEFAGQRLPQGLTRKNFNQLPYLSFNRKDDMQAEFVARCLGLRKVSLQHQTLLPSCEAQVRAVRAGWGVGVLPQLLVQPALEAGDLVEIAPGHALSIALFWHCWNLESRVLAHVSQALLDKARQVLPVD